MMVWSAQHAPEISIVVPALNEAANLPALLERIASGLQGRTYEVLIVDDGSRDGTPDVCRDLARRYPLHLHVRRNPAGGLGGAVLHGLERARGEYLVVMDADLQHPPESIPQLLDPLARNQSEFVLGSRYAPGGTTDGRWGRLRRMNSRVATLLARPFSGDARDPMSGFFALPRSVYRRADQFDPVGYKIALELLCKCRVRRVREVPIHFGVRAAGESKMTVRQQVGYLEHLSRLYDFCFPRASPRVKLLIATALVWLIGFSLYVRLVAGDINPVFAPTLAFAAAGLMTALLYVRSLRRHGTPANRGRAWLDFTLVIVGEWSACILAANWVAYHVRHASMLQVFAFAFGAATLAGVALRTRLSMRRGASII